MNRSLLPLLVLSTLAFADKEQLKRENACKTHSCHPLTECQVFRRKQPGTSEWLYEPVCMKIPSCATHKCRPGEKCELKAVRCQMTPCFKVPTCLADINEASPEFQMPPALLVR